jgi:hypothetical protein
MHCEAEGYFSVGSTRKGGIFRSEPAFMVKNAVRDRIELVAQASNRNGQNVAPAFSRKVRPGSG